MVFGHPALRSCNEVDRIGSPSIFGHIITILLFNLISYDFKSVASMMNMSKDGLYKTKA
jgi:hypothetical protein